MAGKKGRTGTNGKGKTGVPSHRSPEQRDKDDLTILKLMRRGFTLSRVAEEIGVHRTQIASDYQRMTEQLKKDMLTDFEEVYARSLAEIVEIKHMAYASFEESKKDFVKVVKKTSGKEGENGEETSWEEVETREGQGPGDPAFLRIIKESWEAEVELRGLFPAAKKPEMPDIKLMQQIDWAELTKSVPSGEVPDVIEAEIVALLEDKSTVPVQPGTNGQHQSNGDGTESQQDAP